MSRVGCEQRSRCRLLIVHRSAYILTISDSPRLQLGNYSGCRPCTTDCKVLLSCILPCATISDRCHHLLEATQSIGCHFIGSIRHVLSLSGLIRSTPGIAKRHLSIDLVQVQHQMRIPLRCPLRLHHYPHACQVDSLLLTPNLSPRLSISWIFGSALIHASWRPAIPSSWVTIKRWARGQSQVLARTMLSA